MRATVCLIGGLIAGAASVVSAASSDLLTPHADLASSLDAGTHVVMLGTGTPVPDATRAGASVAVVHNHKAYLFDVGGGSVQRAIEAAKDLGIDELDPLRIGHVFFTHLHSDHTLDYVELASTLWWRRTSKLSAWGPKGLKAMTAGMYEMMSTDVLIRTSGSQPVSNPDNYHVNVTEVRPGLVYQDGDFKVHAFAVPHGEIKPAFGYKITTPNKSIVISGDTAFGETLIDQAKGVDILVHEVISEKGVRKLSEFWQTYHGRSHTLTTEVAEIGRRAQPKLLVLYHILFYGEDAQGVLNEVRAGYPGEVRMANDLDVY